MTLFVLCMLCCVVLRCVVLCCVVLCCVVLCCVVLCCAVLCHAVSFRVNSPFQKNIIYVIDFGILFILDKFITYETYSFTKQ